MIDLPDPPLTSGTPLRRSRALAAFLSFVLPGAGQLVSGRVRAGLLFLAPVVAAVGLAVVVSGADRSELLGLLIQPNVLLGIVLLDVLICAWRVVVIVDAWRGGGSAVGHPATAVVVVLLALAGATHFVIGAEVMAARDTITTVFASSGETGELRLPELLDIAKKNLLKTADLPDLARLAEQADVKGMKTYRFVPPTYSSYLDRADIKRIRTVVAHVFDDGVPLQTPAPSPTPTRQSPHDDF